MSTDLKNFIASLTNADQPKGPSVAFTTAHVIKALLIIDAEGTKGRIGLAKALEIGEGSIRTMVKKLVEKTVISVDAIGGCLLTSYGITLVNELKSIMIESSEFDVKELDIQEPSYTLQLRFDLSHISLTKLRDIAVKYGADGMMIFSFKDGIIAFPQMADDIAKTYPKLAMNLKSKFKLIDGDYLLLGFSRDASCAEIGTLAAAIYAIVS